MNSETKLIFDECLSHLMMDALRPFLERAGSKLILRAMVQYYRQGIPDSEWIPQIAAEGGWLILSTDHGRSRNEKPEDRLPYLCRKHRVTHILLSPSVHGLSSFEKGKAIVAVWNEFATIKAATPGTRFVIQFNSSRTQFILVNADTRQAKLNELKRKKTSNVTV